MLDILAIPVLRKLRQEDLPGLHSETFFQKQSKTNKQKRDLGIYLRETAFIQMYWALDLTPRTTLINVYTTF